MAARRRKRGSRLPYLLLAVIVVAAGAFWYVRYYKKTVATPSITRHGVGYKTQDRLKLDKLIEQGDKK